MHAQSLPRMLAAAAILIGGGALLGWRFDIAALRSVVPGQVAMNPMTGLCLVLAGVSLAIGAAGAPRSWPRWLTGGCAVASGMIGLARLGEYLGLRRLGIDSRLFADAVASVGQARMAAPTALSLAVLGGALLWQAVGRRRSPAVVQALALVPGGFALVALAGYLYGAGSVHGPMALHTALGILALSAGVLSAEPDNGLAVLLRSPGSGGLLARRLLPAVVGIPLLIGWLALLGQRAGLYPPEGALALLGVGTIGALAVLTWWSARSLERSGRLREQAERDLRESERRYRLLFEGSPVPAWVYDVESLRFLEVNEAAVRSYGYSREEFGRMTLKDIRPAEDVSELLAAIERVAAGASGGGTWRHRRKDGSLLQAELTSHAFVFDGRRLELVVARDVTEQRRAEAALRASEERFRALATSANDAIVTADAGGLITYINPGAERMFGRPLAEVESRPITVLMPERFQERHRRGLERYLAGGDARVIGRTVELVGLRADGREFPIELSLASWRRGGDVAFTAMIRDITERHGNVEALRRNAAALEAANAELDAFAYSVSHDLRAPLRAIDGFSRVVLDDYGDRLDHAGRDALHRVRAGASRMGTLIDDLLGLSQVVRAELNHEVVGLSELAREISAELREREPERSVEITIAPQLLARGDTRLLRLVLENLLGNAWKYTRGKPRARIEFGAVAGPNGDLAYFVRDDGAGFDMAYADRLFAPFQRLHSQSEFEGTGIGLATVHRIIQRHGGRVWAEGAVGGGATFFFTL